MQQNIGIFDQLDTAAQRNQEQAINLVPSPKNIEPKRKSFGKKYECQSEIGRGGFATVFKAKHRKKDKVVAVKKLIRSGDPQKNDVAVRKFKEEGHVMMQLKHPNVVKCYDMYEPTGESPDGYIVMELMSNSLEDLIY